MRKPIGDGDEIPMSRLAGDNETDKYEVYRPRRGMPISEDGIYFSEAMGFM